jgi:hypothetical protein
LWADGEVKSERAVQESQRLYSEGTEESGGVYHRDAEEAEKGERDPSLRSEDDALKKGHG